jgi:hypothetical protein
MNYIDPVAQVFMDFFSSIHEPNPNGETRLIRYQEWADRARKAMDCACHEGWRTNMTHSQYECHGDKIGILRAEIAEKARKEIEKDFSNP